jgi:hypothetical protein
LIEIADRISVWINEEALGTTFHKVIMPDRMQNGGKLMNRIFGAINLFQLYLCFQRALVRSRCRLQSQSAGSSPQTATTESKPGELRIGEASGSYTAKGQVVELRYAYAGKEQRFGQESMVILLTDKPIPPDAVAEEIKSQKLLLAETITGLEYAIDENGMWVRYHPVSIRKALARTEGVLCERRRRAWC